ncbi:phage tail tip fiber protein [Morganella morganii]|uniref:phage tail tip fiber protein n=1 Tax=Morganella morganii TaxID=582 RepID=UPI0021CF4F4F|nr:hypothetical protein [Morganella morganii]MCU6352521.1 hypothetical protein [Morganella morganii]
MKKLTVSIGNLGSAADGDYVSFNIWQGKRLLLSDQIAGKHSGTFHREYDVDYIQGEPLRIESNAPAGCSVGVNVASSDDAVADTKPSAVFNGVLSIKDNQIFMRETFIDTAWLRSATPDNKVQSENYIPGKSGFLIDYSTGKAEFNGEIVIHKQNGDVACVMGPLVTETKTIEQRVADLEKQLADTLKSTSCGNIDKKDAYSVLVSVETELSKLS